MSAKKVFVALSGGVDSSVAALTLLEQGYALAGIFMRHSFQPVLSTDQSEALLQRTELTKNATLARFQASGEFVSVPLSFDSCPFPLPIDAAEALKLAAQLGIPFVLFDAAEPFRKIVDYFVDEYYLGRTPNPCAICNRTLKFGRLFEAARLLGAEAFATGHFVRIRTELQWREARPEDAPGLPDYLASLRDSELLLESAMTPKDQSYILFNIDRARLPNLLFPLGSSTKEEVRQKAEKNRLVTATSQESQETCFAEDGRHLSFLHSYGGKRETAGSFVSLDGKPLGPHSGYERYTIGQRKGLGIGFGERIFVQRIDPNRREVVLGKYDELARTEIYAENANWLLPLPFDIEIPCGVKIRYRSRTFPATLRLNKDGTFVAHLMQPCYGVAPGQALVCYFENRLLGGGFITISTSCA